MNIIITIYNKSLKCCYIIKFSFIIFLIIFLIQLYDHTVNLFDTLLSNLLSEILLWDSI